MFFDPFCINLETVLKNISVVFKGLERVHPRTTRRARLPHPYIPVSTEHGARSTEHGARRGGQKAGRGVPWFLDAAVMRVHIQRHEDMTWRTDTAETGMPGNAGFSYGARARSCKTICRTHLKDEAIYPPQTGRT